MSHGFPIFSMYQTLVNHHGVFLVPSSQVETRAGELLHLSQARDSSLRIGIDPFLLGFIDP